MQKETCEKFLEASKLEKDGKLYRATSTAADALSEILGDHFWSRRICNQAGDFAEVNVNTLSFWLHERQQLDTYVIAPNGTLKKNKIHRGYCLICRFVKNYGNRYDLDLV